MSKLLALAFGVGLLLCIVACNDNESPQAEGQKFLTYDEFLSYIYKEPGENGKWIVDGDTPISSEKLLWEFYERNFSPESSSIIDPIERLIVGYINGADVVWTHDQKRNITYCISESSFKNQYDNVVQAMNDATGAWEAVADINFDHIVAEDENCTESNTSVIFDIRQTSGADYLARAFFPNDMRKYRNILIDTSSFKSTKPDLIGILRHELGHTIGFRHEHTRPEAGTCFEDNNWRVLTPYDSKSVMHYPQCNGTGDRSLSLTELDIQGIQALYGAPNSDPITYIPVLVTEKTPTITIVKGVQNSYGPFLVVPETSFKAVISGAGDADLYIKSESAPTKSSFDCRPYLNGSVETCDVTILPAAVSNMYVMVDGYTDSTYTLTMTYTKPDERVGSPIPQQVVRDIASKPIAKGTFHTIPAITVTPGTQFTVEMTGTGDADLYVKMGSVPPTLSSYTCRPLLSSSVETCIHDVPADINKVSIGVNGFKDATYSLKITYYVIQKN